MPSKSGDLWQESVWEPGAYSVHVRIGSLCHCSPCPEHVSVKSSDSQPQETGAYMF